ncbi:MAG: glycosyltransferase family 1 protein [Candidatus Peregrinibacteria bacterium]
MKIGVNARFLVHPYTGIGQYTRYLMQMLSKIDRKNEYFLFTPELVEWNLPDHFHQIRVPERSSHSPSLAKAHWEHVLVPQELLKWKIDLAHFLYPANPWKRLPLPTVVTVHDVIPWRLKAYNKRLRSKLYHFYVRQALKKADHIITVSEFSKREIMDIFKIQEKNIAVIPHGLPLFFWGIPLPDLPLRRDFLLYVGGYDERKNIPRLIKAYLKHIANDHKVDLILVGGKNRNLERYITGEFAYRVASDILVQPKGNIIFTNVLSNDELAVLYKQATALISPSVYEGFNLPLVEAMAAGILIVASDITVNREVTGEAALFFDPKSVDSIGEGILKLLGDSGFRKKLVSKGTEFVKRYNWEKSAEAVLGVYNLFT